MPIECRVVVNKLPQVLPIVRAGAEEAVLVGAQAQVDDAKARLIEADKSGHKYDDLPNVSSAPGQSPASQLGGLVDSLRVEEGEVSGAIQAVSEAGDGSMVATYLEAGTSRMAPRPFFGPAEEAGEAAFVAASEAVMAKLNEL
jgi:hypothetical protein